MIVLMKTSSAIHLTMPMERLLLLSMSSTRVMKKRLESKPNLKERGGKKLKKSHPLADLGAFVTTASSPLIPANSLLASAASVPASAAASSVPISAAAASVPASTVTVRTGDQTSEPKKIPLEVRRAQLRKYELLMLDVDGVKKAEYEKLFSEKKFFEERDTGYRALLLLKIDAVGVEEESVDALLESLIPKNIPKRKTKRKTLTNQIQGEDRYNPLSVAFKEQLRQVEERKKKKGSTTKQPKGVRTKKQPAAIVDQLINNNARKRESNNRRTRENNSSRDSNNTGISETDKTDNVLHMGQQVMKSGLLGRKAKMAGPAMHVANTDTSSETEGILGTGAASGLMGHEGGMTAHAAGLGQSKGDFHNLP